MNLVWKKTAFAILAFCSALVLANLVVYAFSSSQTSHIFLKKSASQMKKLRPDIVLIGDSTLGKSVHPQRFSKLVRKRTLRLDHGGASSAAWYLTLKNIALKAERKPLLTVIFFRDCFLTMPTYRTSGEYRLHLQDLSMGNEPLVEAITYGKSADDIFLSRMFPLYRFRKQLKGGVDSFVKERVVGGVMRQKKDFAQKSVVQTFSDKNMDPEWLNAAQKDAEAETEIPSGGFSLSVERSYLPAMIEEANAASVKLIFVRVKRRRDAAGIPESKELKKYIRELSAYLKQNHVPLIDFTYEQRIELKHFADGDHLSRASGGQLFTQLFAARIKRYLPHKAHRKLHK